MGAPIERLAQVILVHILECGKCRDGATYAFMWRTTTALALSSKQMTQAVREWRSTISTMNFLPHYRMIFIDDDDDPLPLPPTPESNERRTFFLHNVKQFLIHKLGDDVVEDDDVTELKHKYYVELRKTIARAFPNVETLVLERYPFGSELCEPIVSLMPQLKKLDIRETSYFRSRDARLIWERLPHLVSLSVASANINDNHVVVISKNYAQLESLALRECHRVTNAGVLVLVRRVPRLRVLELTKSRVDDGAIVALANKCPQLECLDLSESHELTDVAVRSIATSCTALQSLKLDSCERLTDAAFVDMEKCTLLHTLSVGECDKLTNAALGYIAKCSSLCVFNMSRCDKVDDDGVRALAEGCSRLREIHMCDCSNVGDRGIRSLTIQGSNIEHIDASGVRNLTCDAFGLLLFLERRCSSSSSGLRILSLWGCTNVGKAALACIANCANLNYLMLRGCVDVDDDDVIHLTARCKHLRCLNLDLCTKLTDASITSISLERLESISLRQCDHITDTAISSLKRSCPQLKMLALDGCTSLSAHIRHAATRERRAWSLEHSFQY